MLKQTRSKIKVDDGKKWWVFQSTAGRCAIPLFLQLAPSQLVLGQLVLGQLVLLLQAPSQLVLGADPEEKGGRGEEEA